MNILGFHFGRSNAPVKFGMVPAEVASAAADILLRQGFRPDGKGGLFSSLPPEFRYSNEKMMRAYDAAITTSYNMGFRATYGSQDAETMSSLYTTVAHVRTLCKDTPHGKNYLRVLANNVIGHRGFRLNMRMGKRKSGKFEPDVELNAAIERIYELSGRPENFSVSRNMTRNAAWRIMIMSAARDGKIMLRHYRGFPKNKFGYAVRLLEGDRLQESYCGRSANGNEIRMSVEVDEWRGPVAYHVLSRHPGDPFGSYDRSKSNVWREIIPADEIVLYNNMWERAEATIGFPELDSVVQHMYRDQQYETAMTLAAIASCCKPYWIKKIFPTGMTFTSEEAQQLIASVSNAMNDGPFGTNGLGNSSGAVARQQGVTARVETMVPAGITPMNYGEELMQTEATFPDQKASDFKRDNLHAVSAGGGVSYQALSGDYQNLGFSASRACQIPQQDQFKVMQENFIEMVVRVEFRERMEAAIMAGLLDCPMSRLDEIVESASWVGRRWEFVNPIQDAQAMILLKEAGLLSPQQCQERMADGVSNEDLYQLYDEDQEEQKAHNLDFSGTQVTKPTIKQGEVNQELPEPSVAAQPPSVTKTPNPIRSQGISDTTFKIMQLQENELSHNGNGSGRH